jgi:hypothetical protein
MHKAVQILDNCILNTISVSIKANTSALVPMCENDLSKVILGVFNQASEFIGLNGRIVASTELLNSLTKERNACSVALIRVSAQRYHTSTSYENPVDYFVHQFCLPHYFGRYVNRDLSQLNHARIPKPLHLQDLDNALNEELVEADFLDKLSSIVALLESHNGSVHFKVLSNEEMEFRIQLPLVEMNR